MDYVITGIGIYNGLGKDIHTSFEKLLNGESTFKTITWPEDNPATFPQTYKNLKSNTAGVSPPPEDSECVESFQKYWRDWDPNTRTGLLTVDQAVSDAGLSSKEVGVIFSTFGAGTSIRLDLFSAINLGKMKYSPRKCLNIGLDFPAAQISAIYGFQGPNTSLDSACTTGLTAIETAVNTMKAYPELDAMVVGASDRMFEPIYVYWFQSLGALSPTGISAPFDNNRNGFVMGEGAGTLVIEPLDKAQARGAKIYAVIKGSGSSTLFDSDTSPDPEGQGARQCMTQAITRAGITVDDVDYINAHATGTPVGDIVEYNAIADIMPSRTVVSNKGQIGHCMSASGIIEVIYTVMSIQTGYTPGNGNLSSMIGAGELVLPTAKTKIDIRNAVKNSFGFGGRNASIVLGRYEN
jgi:3-oxoacyl-[acyl-carrier-protein] synthase II